jgi:hypothetical protein
MTIVKYIKIYNILILIYMSSLQIQYSSRSKCKKFFNTFPNLTPEIYSFSTYNSNNGDYTTVYVSGINFLINNTYIKFGNIRIQASFISSQNISFVVQNFKVGKYNVNAVNLVYYSPQYQPAILYSNTIEYNIL